MAILNPKPGVSIGVGIFLLFGIISPSIYCLPIFISLTSRILSLESHIIIMLHDPGNIAFCKHCRTAWFVKEKDMFNKIIHRHDEDVRKYFLCRECGHEITVLMKNGNDFTEMDYDKYLIFSVTKAL